MTHADELLARLESHAESQIEDNLKYIQEADALMREAAALIRTLTAERDAARRIVEAEREEGRREAVEWRDIESAPKDGTLILLWCRFIDRDEPHVARYVEPNGRPGDFGEFCWSTYSDPGKGEIAERVPTHWMPLPEPPRQAAQTEGGGR